MKMKEVLFPEPLLEPDRWPMELSEPGELVVLSLELAASCGGPLRDFYLRLVRTGKVAWYIDPRSFTGSQSARILKSSAESWLESHSESPLFVDASDPFTARRELTQNIGFAVSKMRVSLSRSLPRFSSPRAVAEHVFETVFKDLIGTLGREKARRYLLAYLDEMPEAMSSSWDGLRFFPGFVRRKERGVSPAAEWASLDWARFRALFSPQSERDAYRSLRPGEAALNPTLEVVSLQSSVMTPCLRAICRAGNSLCETELSWMEAAIVDEAYESPRFSVQRLVQELEGRFASGRHPFEPLGSFHDRVQGLVKKGVLIRNPGS